MIRQIFSNAIKYSENGTIYVKSSLINEQVQVQIKDEGRGIYFNFIIIPIFFSLTHFVLGK